ncbi:MAG: hypothetical protein GQ581_10140 [Methyloprofundus sp.]|nr:hypothetical protein [Methyloprofundus sp.]
MKAALQYFVALLLAHSTFTAQAVQVPFFNTGDLFVLESNSGILRITPDADISVFLSIQDIEAVIGFDNSGLSDNGIAFDDLGNFYFADDNHVLKYTQASHSLSLLASELSIATAQGDPSMRTDVDAIAIDANGDLFVTDDRTEAVLKINANTGAVSVHASQADFLAQTGLDVNLEQGIVAGLAGDIYVASQAGGSSSIDDGDAIFVIDANGNISTLMNNDRIADPDQFMTTDLNGDLIVASDEGDNEQIFKVSIVDGHVNDFISTVTLEGLLNDLTPDVDVRGGLAYDYLGNLFIGDSDEDLILKFDAALNGSIFVTAADILAVTGASRVNLGAGFAFAPTLGGPDFGPVPEPAVVWLVCVGGLMLLTKSKPRKQFAGS